MTKGQDFLVSWPPRFSATLLVAESDASAYCVYFKGVKLDHWFLVFGVLFGSLPWSLTGAGSRGEPPFFFRTALSEETSEASIMSPSWSCTAQVLHRLASLYRFLGVHENSN